MSPVAALFNTTCTVSRLGAASTNALGEQARTYGAHLSGVRCRLETSSGRETQGDVRLARVTHWLYCAVADIVEKDRVTVGSVTYLVEFVNARPGGVAGNHMEIGLAEERA